MYFDRGRLKQSKIDVLAQTNKNTTDVEISNELLTADKMNDPIDDDIKLEDLVDANRDLKDLDTIDSKLPMLV